MNHPSVYINGYRFDAGEAFTYPGPTEHAPTEALHILVNVNRSVLDDPTRPGWVDDTAAEATIRAALDEIALRSIGWFPVVVGR